MAMSTSVLKASPGKLDIKRHSPSILYVQNTKDKKAQYKPPGSGSDWTIVSEWQATALAMLYIGRTVTCPKKTGCINMSTWQPLTCISWF